MSEKENKVCRKELSQDQRSQIIGAYLCGVSPLTIAKTFGYAKSTVYDTVKRYKETGSKHPSKRPGPQKILSECDERILSRIANKNRKTPLT
ncbi:5776_t:CDS:1, partial [Acaulospora morrowiae]